MMEAAGLAETLLIIRLYDITFQKTLKLNKWNF